MEQTLTLFLVLAFAAFAMEQASTFILVLALAAFVVVALAAAIAAELPADPDPTLPRVLGPYPADHLAPLGLSLEAHRWILTTLDESQGSAPIIDPDGPIDPARARGSDLEPALGEELEVAG